MKNAMILTSALAILGTTAMGGGIWPNSQNWPMEHVSISMDGTDLHVHADTSASNRIEMNRFVGEVYSGGAGVLTETYYSDQYGWVAGGFIDQVQETASGSR